MRDSTKLLLQCVAFLFGLAFLWYFTGGRERTIQDLINVQVQDSAGRTLLNKSGDGGAPFFNWWSESTPVYTGSNSYYTAPVPNIDYSKDPRYADLTNKSPYFRAVTLQSGNLGATVAADEYMRLRAESGTGSGINISGWKIVSTESGRVASIKKGLERMYPEALNNTELDIILRPGDSVYLSTGRSPQGHSFRENKCTGYYEQFFDYSPSLSMNCPRLSQEKLPARPNQLKDNCLDYIRSFPQCQLPQQNIPEKYAGDCQSFVESHVGYAKCFDLHKNDADFLTNEWRVFLGYDEDIWKSQRETIQLLDAQGRVVDQYKYGY